MKDLKKGNDRSKWMEREPYAYWKGNPFVAESRQDLLKCNVSDSQDWNARLFIQVTHKQILSSYPILENKVSKFCKTLKIDHSGN